MDTDNFDSNSESDNGHGNDGNSESSDSAEETEESDGDSDDEGLDGPLYPGARITVSEYMLSVLMFYVRDKESKVGLDHLLKLTELCCPEPNRCPRSWYRLKKLLLKGQEEPTRHAFCGSCEKKLEDFQANCDNCGSSEKSYCLTMSVKAQLQAMYKRPDFCDLLNYKNTRVKINVENYEDILDGIIHQELSRPGRPLANPNNISFFWNTDGVSIYGSSNYEVWPWYYTINELKDRYHPENVILGGISFGRKQPNPNMFMDTMIAEMAELKQGVDFKLSDPNTVRHVEVYTIGGICDLVAKAKFLNMAQFNGRYGCQVCKSVCKRINNKPVYKWQEVMKLRTTQETLREAEQAFNREPVFGVNGPTSLKMLAYDYIYTTMVDDLHCVYLGVVKYTMRLFFDFDYRNEDWSLYLDFDTAEERFSEVCPPNFVHRLPRKIEDSAKWKGSELKNWLLAYSLAMYFNLLPYRYYEHYKLLVVGIFLLSQKSVSEQDIETAQQLLDQYVYEFEKFYGKDKVLPVVHHLRHLPGCVRKFGPLPCFSCFHYEDMNGRLKCFVHGTRYAPDQIASGSLLLTSVAELKQKHLDPESRASKFCEKLQAPSNRRKRIHVTDEFQIVGTMKILRNVPDEVSNLLLHYEIEWDKLYEYKRLLQRGVYFETIEYTRTVKTDSTCVLYKNDDLRGIGIFQKFLRVYQRNYDGGCQAPNDCVIKHYAIISKMISTPIPLKTFPNLNYENGFRCDFTGEDLLIDIEETSFSSCFYINLKDQNHHFVFVSANNIADK